MGTEAIAMVLSIAIYGETATAKTIDLSPQLASEEYWGTHHICVVKIKDIRKDPAGVSKVTYEVQSCLTESNAEPRRTLPASHLWFGNDLEVAPAVSKGETLVIFYQRQGVGGIAAVKLGEPPNESPIMKQLLRLAWIFLA
jgi:hypothetical protein